MLITVLHTGQSGVERGADRAGRLTGLRIEGYCSREGRDELGVLPPEILRDLKPCSLAGSRNALRATLKEADAIVIAVPDLQLAREVTGVEALRRSARKAHIPVWLVDPMTHLETVGAEIDWTVARDPVRVLISGPRLTRWADGERIGSRIVAELSMHGTERQKKYRVLVVDDEQGTAETACELIQSLGHACAIALDGAAALKLASEFQPNVALLDLSLPDATGYELARRLRERQTAPLFLAAVTGWSGAHRAKSIDAGFDCHIVKPATGSVIAELLSDASAVLAAS